MPDLLLELYSEEIPARMQVQAQENLKKLVTSKLVDAGLTYEGAKAFSTPRRLTLAVHGLLAKAKDTCEEKKGPRVGAPDGAIQGFLKSAGLKSISEAKIQQDKKGDFYIALIEKKGRPTEEVIKEIVPEVVKNFPWPKSMRWGAGSLSWVRPLHSIVCTFGPETEEPEIIRFDIDGVKSGDITHGHPVMAPGAIKVKRFEDYLDKLSKANVIIDRDRRKNIIITDARNLVLARKLELIEDDLLLEEVAGLVEWPVVLMGEFDRSYLEIPQEVIRATIRTNQKCFVLKDFDGQLANRFILVSNLDAVDSGVAIRAGNSRVIRARLSDAKFFWDQDRKEGLESRFSAFKKITYHERLGTQAERIERIVKLAKIIAPVVNADIIKVERAAKLAKLDLITEVVGEFPELQGVMGKHYALAEGIEPEIANAIEEHYKPQGPNDRVPTSPISIAVALADKIHTLVGFWVIDEVPTGSKDPYALRRAALGVIRIIITNKIRVRLSDIWPAAFGSLQYAAAYEEFYRNFLTAVADIRKLEMPQLLKKAEKEAMAHLGSRRVKADQRKRFPILARSLLSFFSDRLKVYLRDQGKRHDLVDAVFSTKSPSDLLIVVEKVESLEKFLNTSDGMNLVSGYRRAVNILRDEEKIDEKKYFGKPVKKLLKEPEEKLLFLAIKDVEQEVTAALKVEAFEAAMSAISKLRQPVDAFFEKVTVNADDKALRENRLKLLNRIREATRHVADFSKIAG